MGPFLLSTFLCFIDTVTANIFEYQAETQPLRPCELQREKAFQRRENYVPQCLEDGQYRNVQCDNNGLSCWCVDDKGVEVPGSKQAGSAIACLSFCQLQKQQILVSRYINSTTTSYLPQCLDSGDFDPVQCDVGLGQCWCVDAEGMEIYGTRQRGKPLQCPGKCEIRDRRILHGVGEKSPPQCSADGEFLPVQCKFINTTDRMVFDLLHNFNRFPEQFLTFSSFRTSFPEVSGYCYCADSLGREIEETGLEMLLENVYDTVFALMEPPRTFTDTTMYRILQRRFLGVQLAVSGRFRCPSKCEMERSTAFHFKHHYKPLCDESGAYKPTQCQLDGQCWCVDTKGQELVGTRRQGKLPPCGEEHACVSERQRSLSRLFHGPVGHFSRHSLFSASQQIQKTSRFSNPCPPSYKELLVDSDVLSPILEKASTSDLLTLESVLSEAVGGMFPSRELASIALQFTSSPKQFQENLFGGMFLKNLIQFNFTGALGTNSNFNLERNFQQVGLSGGLVELAQQLSLDIPEKFNLSQPIQDRFGRNISLQDNQNTVRFLALVLEMPEFFTFLESVVSVPESFSVDLGDVARIVLKSKDCQEQDNDFFVPSCAKDGGYREIQCYAGDCWCVDRSGKEIPGSRVRGTQPRCPTVCKKQRESLQQLKRSQPAGSELFVPSCTQEGKFLPLQCHGINCFCVNLEGRAIPGINANSEQPVQCPSDCQLAGGQAFLRTVRELLLDPTSLPQLSSVYIPQCSLDGQWRQVQCNGPPEQAFEWYQRWITHNNNGNALPFRNLLNILLDYKEKSQQSFEVFIKILYESGHQNIFPEFSRYPSFDSVPQDVLVGNMTVGSPDNILLDPFTFWQILHGHLLHYPGSYGDFSAPLKHFDLRNCWCVDEKGQIQGKEAEVNKIPECPRACDAAKREAMQFVSEVEQLIRASNTSHFPFGQSFLMAKGVRLTDDELLNISQLGTMMSEKLLAGSNYAIQLAAQSTLHFYRRNLFSSRDSAGEVVRLAFQPYIPQCDGLGNWDPVQCYKSSGHCWCVDGRGRYISGTLVTRSAQLPQCQTPCQRSRANTLIARWRRTGSKQNATAAELFTPSCQKVGTYSVLQKSDTQAWCVDPASGEVLQQSSIDSDGRAQCPGYCSMMKSQSLLREPGPRYVPQCEIDNETFSPVQWDEAQESYWCVFANGEEAPGTRVHGKKPACERPQCRLPFGNPDLNNGGLFCNNVSSLETPSIQQCKVICAPGFHSTVSSAEMLLCDTESRLWRGEPPHPQTCQKLQLYQSVQTQSQFQLLLPPEKTCSPDYSGLLEAFQIFILDEMNARGFCHIQGNAFGHLESAPVCDDSSVHVECLAEDRLGVNIKWRAWLEDVPAASFPDLHSIEKAMVGENLIGRFESLIKSGDFVLHLDSKQFQADSSIRFLRDVDFNISPGVYFGCRDGFLNISAAGGATPDLQGCVVCPPGSSFQNGLCIPCPSGFYQDQAGSLSCIQCPSEKTTVSTGAFRAEQCITDCQMNEEGLRCDENGRYRPSYKNSTTKTSFCVDSSGKILEWTETNDSLTDSQCSVLIRFERVPLSKLSFTTEVTETVGSMIFQGEPGRVLQQCIAECAKDESCGHLALSAVGTETLCELYSAQESNYNCSASGLIQGAWGNPVTTRITDLTCLVRVRSQDKDAVRVFLKKGQEFTTAGVKTFERTEFQDVVSGVYRNLILSAAGTSLTDVHLFCRQTCGQEACCDGFILSQILLDGGSIICGLMSYPDVLTCNIKDWDSKGGRRNACQKVNYNEDNKQYTLRLGGQVLTGTSEGKKETAGSFASFQRVYLWKDSDMMTRVRSSVCDVAVAPTQTKPLIPGSAMELFSLLEISQILVDQNRSLPSQESWLLKHRFSAEEAFLWCLARCVEEESCQLVDIPNVTTATYFPCTLYPGAQVCDNIVDNVPEKCHVVLPQNPRRVYQKTVVLEGSVKNFYTRLPFRKVSRTSMRNKMDMSGKTVSNGFFDCERLCDADPCCTGFQFVNASKATGGKVLCLILNSLGIQTCSEELISDWQVSDCASLETGDQIHPFGWYQKTESVPSVCPSVLLPGLQENMTLDKWQRIDVASVLVDVSISKFDILHISRDVSNGFSAIRDFCLSVCSKDKFCLVTTLETQPSATRCMFYPETQSCTLDLQGHHCRLLLKEPATYIYQKQDASVPFVKTGDTLSVTISSQGALFGTSQVIQMGSNWKSVSQFLGIPYAAAPLAENRFRPPQAFTWMETWNATAIRLAPLVQCGGLVDGTWSPVTSFLVHLNRVGDGDLTTSDLRLCRSIGNAASCLSRASCWQPGDGEISSTSVSEDCLYLNIYVPDNTGGNLPVLVFFHNGMSGDVDQPRTVIDGSFLAAAGNIIVVTASYRVGVFGFFSTGSSVAIGNWGLLDQEAALKWVQKYIASFGGDPAEITVAADRSGADVASIHLFAGTTDSGIFKRALLMGGSAFSPASAISQQKAQVQAAVLARELGCPSASSEEMVSCLRQLPAKALNDAQTRLLAVSGPFQYWSPLTDGFCLQEPLTADPQCSQPLKVDLLIGSAQQDGLISRSKAIKRFEASQGRADSKTAFYKALQNSLGGEDSNPLVQDAATWFYSLEHSSDEYASFSRALENATRDYFIICPTIDLAKHWAANNRGKVFMYHVPESSSMGSSSLEFLPDVQYAFGLPFDRRFKNQYTQEQKTLSLTVMQYLANFIKSGNPNSPYQFTRSMFGLTSPWPMFQADTDGDNYKEFTTSLENRRGLKKAECSFWDNYIKTLKASTGCKRESLAADKPRDDKAVASVSKTTQVKPLGDKVAYSK